MTKALGRRDDVPPPTLHWTETAGPLFGNALAELELDGRAAHFTLRRADAVADREDTLTTVTSIPPTG